MAAVIICVGREARNAVDMRRAVVTVVAGSISVSAFAQTQPTAPSAFRTVPTMSSAFATSSINPCRSSFNPTSPCYSGTIYPSYSALPPPFEFPEKSGSQDTSMGAKNLDEDQARQQIEAKGYSKVANLERDSRGIWRGNAELKDGRSVHVTLDLEGNIYSELSRLVIEVRPPRVPVPQDAPLNSPRTNGR